MVCSGRVFCRWKGENTICYAIIRLVFVISLRCAPASDVWLRCILTPRYGFPRLVLKSSSTSRNYTSHWKYPSAGGRDDVETRRLFCSVHSLVSSSFRSFTPAWKSTCHDQSMVTIHNSINHYVRWNQQHTDALSRTKHLIMEVWVVVDAFVVHLLLWMTLLILWIMPF